MTFWSPPTTAVANDPDALRSSIVFTENYQNFRCLRKWKKETLKKTGFKWLEPQGLESQKTAVKEALGLEEDYYRVSKSLVQAARLYSWSWILVLNESAKVIRSTVIPTAVLGLWLLHKRSWCWGSLLLLPPLVS